MRLLDEEGSKRGSRSGEADIISTSEDCSLLPTSGEDAVILISGEGDVYLCSMGEQLSLNPGEGDKLQLTTGEHTCLNFAECSGEEVLDPGLVRQAALSRSGEGAVFFKSGETAPRISSGDDAFEMTGEGGVYRGAGVETELPGSTDNLWLSGVAVVSLSAVEGSDVWGESFISGVEPLLKRSGREILPLSSGKGDEA